MCVSVRVSMYVRESVCVFAAVFIDIVPAVLLLLLLLLCIVSWLNTENFGALKLTNLAGMNNELRETERERESERDSGGRTKDC